MSDSLIQKIETFQSNYTEEIDTEFYVVERCIDIIRQHEAASNGPDAACSEMLLIDEEELLQLIAGSITRSRYVSHEKGNTQSIDEYTYYIWRNWLPEAKEVLRNIRVHLRSAPSRELSHQWVRKADFRGEPNSCSLGWWWSDFTQEQPYLDEILIDDEGFICGKGGCGADYYSHVMLAGIERPKAPSKTEIEGGTK